jgi:dynein heavy chain
MRAVRSVINAAGLLKADSPDTNEQQLLLRALRDVNVPKFLKDDIPLFENIILDLFPGVERPAVDYGGLREAISTSCEHFNVQEVDLFIQKILQLYDTIQVRHGLMIVGPTGGGKSSNYRVLRHAMSSLSHFERFEKVHVDVLNPKSITMGQLYGYVDPQTAEWMDGVLAKLVLDCTKDESPDKHWVMFDGPVDALWIENMNTVLDDNKKLCLNSGQIITLTPRMTMMFEVADLAVASPATVSRCGMVYMEPASLGLAPYLTSWLNTLPPRVAANPGVRVKLQALGDAFLEDACYFLRHELTEPVVTVDNNLVQSLFRILDCYMADYVETEVKKVAAEKVDEFLQMVPELFVFALVWSIGTTTTLAGREKFNLWLRERLPKAGVDFPAEKLVYDYTYDRQAKCWVSWLDTIPEYEVNIQMSYNEIVVPTLDSVRMKYLAALMLTNGKHVLTPGPTGTGKSVNTAEMLTYELPSEYQTLVMTFSAQTSANQTQDYLDEKFEKRRKGVYGPPVGKKFVIFVDDLNMPKKEEYGAQPPLELLRQWLDHRGWYDRKAKEKPFNKIEDIVFVAAMGPPGGGRSVITARA